MHSWPIAWASCEVVTMGQGRSPALPRFPWDYAMNLNVLAPLSQVTSEDSDPLRPARGVMMGVALGAVIWAGIIAICWWLL
jgi:hypothetical protein